MILRRMVYGFMAMALSTSSLFVLASPVAYAATVAWDGEGSDNNFSTAVNWVGDIVPANGDAITFDSTTMLVQEDLNNDIIGLSLDSISINGTGSRSGLAINGNGFTVANGIINNVVSGSFSVSIETDVTLAGSQVFQGVSFNNEGASIKTVSLSTYDLSIVDTQIYSNIVGAGNIIVNDSTDVSAWTGLYGVNTFTGSATVNSGGHLYSGLNGLGTTAGNTVVANGASLSLDLGNNDVFAEPLSLNGTGIDENSPTLSVNECFGVCVTTAQFTLSGPVTLNSNVVLGTEGTVTLTGPLSGAYTINLQAGTSGKLINNSSDNQSKMPGGQVVSETKTQTYSDSNQDSIFADDNNVAVVTGERGSVYVGGGVLKGTGKVGIITMSSGKVAPGLSPGILSTGNLVFSGGTLEIEIGGTTAGNGDGNHDQTNVTGTVDLGANVTALSLIHWNNFRPALNNQFVIINNDGSDAVTGTFQGLVQDATVVVDGITYTISYTGGDGNDVVLTATSVPAAPTAPDTGFELLAVNPIATLAVSVTAIAALLYARRQYAKK